jgi:hypothetical protein
METDFIDYLGAGAAMRRVGAIIPRWCVLVVACFSAVLLALMVCCELVFGTSVGTGPANSGTPEFNAEVQLFHPSGKLTWVRRRVFGGRDSIIVTGKTSAANFYSAARSNDLLLDSPIYSNPSDRLAMFRRDSENEQGIDVRFGSGDSRCVGAASLGGRRANLEAYFRPSDGTFTVYIYR